jgi:UvrD/REP helicase N-terminal domain
VFVGTIHSYCFLLLQRHVPRYETYDVLDDNQLTAFLAREGRRLEVRQLEPGGRLFASIAAFMRGVDVVENELLDPATMPDPFGTVLKDYYSTLDRYRLLTYGQQIVRTVRELERPELAAKLHGTLRHLIVDEYQDINPAQERLIELLTGPDVELCVVGDDQQAIYQWRGSNVSAPGPSIRTASSTASVPSPGAARYTIPSPARRCALACARAASGSAATTASAASTPAASVSLRASIASRTADATSCGISGCSSGTSGGTSRSDSRDAFLTLTTIEAGLERRSGRPRVCPRAREACCLSSWP